MKLIQLFEANHNFNIDLIKQKCAPWLEAAGTNFVYRGSGISSLSGIGNDGLFKGKVRKDRKPRDSTAELHNLLNKYFYEKTGIKYRSESLFVSGDKDKGYEYGSKVFAIFPIGEFHYAWSDEIEDPWVELEFNMTDEEKVTRRQEFESHLEYDDPYKFDEGLEEAIESKNEIMIACDEYYAVAITSTFYRELCGVLKNG